MTVVQETKKPPPSAFCGAVADCPGTYRDCDWEIAERLKKVAAGKNCSPAQAALAWMLSKPYMASPIIGATNLDQLTSAAQATDFNVTDDEAKLLEEPYQFRVSPAN